MTGALDRGEDGFTLLELLIAMTLLGLVFALVSGALSFGAAAWRTGGERLERNTSLQAVNDLLRRRIGGALALRGRTRLARGSVAFEGRPDSLIFAGAAPARAMPDGVFAYKLSVENRRLVLRWGPMGWVDGAPTPPDDLEPQVLVSDVDRLDISYLAPEEDGTPGTWRSSWDGADGMPRLVRMSVRFAQGDDRQWPDLLIAVHTW